MPYTDFSLESVVSRFQVNLRTQSLFPNLLPVAFPEWLNNLLSEGRQLSLVSEKARSEYIVAPLLLAVRLLTDNRVAIYSGQRFDVDASTGLVGECDFLLAATEPLPIIRAPLVSVVEAKRGDIDLGLGQCSAQMIAALQFNRNAGQTTVNTIYGCVTTGNEWAFLRLEGDTNTLTFDTQRYFIDDVPLILAAFLHIVAEVSPAP